MAIEKRTIGTGIFAEEVPVATGADAGPELVRHLEARKRIYEECGRSEFRVITSDVVRTASEIIDRAHSNGVVPPFLECTLEEFSQRILRYYEISNGYISKGDADEAARFAFQMGFLACQAGVKQNWESKALEGARTSKSRDESNRKRYEESADLTRKVGADYEAEAASLGRGKSKIALARVAQKYGLTEKAVSKRLTNYNRTKAPPSLEEGE